MKILIGSLLIVWLAAVCGGCASLPQTARNPSSSVPLLELQSLAAVTDTEERDYLTRIRAQPDDTDTWFRLANYYAVQNQWEKAEQAYREVLQRHEHSGARHNLGLVQIRMGLRALQEAAQELPPQHPVHAETREFLRAALESAAY